MKVKDNRQSIVVHKIEKIYSLFTKIYYILTIKPKQRIFMKFQANIPFKLTKLFYEKLGEQPVNKRVLVIRDLFTAMHASIDNAVTFVTDDKEACELFNKNVVSNDEFGNDDTVLLVDTEINKNAWKDFIKELANMPKFDVIIGNPPYGQRGMGSLDLHYEIAAELFGKYNEKMIFIMPGRIGFSTSEKFDKWKKKFTNLSNMENVGNPFENVAIASVYIFTFENHNVDKVTVKGIEYNSLFDISPFTEYENKFMSVLKNDTPNYNSYCPLGNDKTVNAKQFNDRYFERFNKNSILTISSKANGGMNAQFLSSADEKYIFDNHEDLKKMLYNRKNVCKVFSEFNIMNAAENYIAAIQRPLCRFGLSKMQDDQNMTERCYRYIPNIDWSDVRTKTDEGILEMVGFSKEESKEFAEYTKNYMNTFDEQFNNAPKEDA
jgi:hypothetical protein